MILKYFYDDKLAQASYMVGCAATGDALVIDPMRDIRSYLKTAKDNGLKITHVTETHIHADYVSGSRELANATGAQLYLSDEGTEDWKYAYAKEDHAILVTDGDMWMVGNIRVDVLHTPGHTPEHISFMITDTAGANKPMGVFTGDFIFVGDVGRPDLLEEAAGITGTKEPGARQQFQSVKRFKDMPDYLQIWPGHGAGSACGKALGAIPSTTLGYEKLFNPAFQFDDENKFVAWLLDGQPEAPKYFAQMKKVNKLGPAIIAEAPSLTKLDRASLDTMLADNYLVIDLRDREAYAQSHISGTISIPMTSANYLTYIGWFVDFEQPIYFIIPDDADASQVMKDIQSIGVDNLSGYFGEDVITGNTVALPQLSAKDVADQLSKNGMIIVDVRGKTEYDEQHINNATHIPLGFLPDRTDELPKDHTIVVNCASGYRSQVATSILRRQGFENVYNLNDPKAIWSQVLPIE